MLYLTDEEVEAFAKIVKNIMYYDNRIFKIINVTNDGYYIFEIKNK